jgi:T5orf172 domain
METDQASRPSLRIFGVAAANPGFIYILEDRGRYKIGKSKNSTERLKAAKTWLPDMKLIGCKPFWNFSNIERYLHTAFSRSWYAGEWFEFECDDDKSILLDGFSEFSDTNRDWNSVNFIYWFNGNGMSEFVIELSRQKVTLPKFLKQESSTQKEIITA